MQRTVLSHENNLLGIPNWISHALLYYDNIARFRSGSEQFMDTRILGNELPKATKETLTNNMRRCLSKHDKNGSWEKVASQSLISDLMSSNIIKDIPFYDGYRKSDYQSAYLLFFNKLNKRLSEIDSSYYSERHETSVVLIQDFDENVSNFERLLKDNGIEHQWTHTGFCQESFCHLPAPIASLAINLMENEIISLYQAEDEVIIDGFSKSSSFESVYDQDKNGHASLRLVWSEVFPGPVTNTPLSKILEFREKYDSQRIRYIDEIDDLCGVISNAENTKEVKNIIKSFNKSKKDRIVEYEAALEKSGIYTNVGYCASLLPIGVGLSQAILSSGDGLLDWSSKVAAGISVSAIAYLKNYADRQYLSKTNAYSYIYHAQKRGITNKDKS